MPNDASGGAGRADPAQQQQSTSPAPSSGGQNAMCALGDLICDLNPYTELQPDPTTNHATGPMQLVMLPPADSNPGAVASMAVEIDDHYSPTWNFKGQPQAVRSAVRIPYRFPVKKGEKTLYWQTEYLLIGFVGAGGGG